MAELDLSRPSLNPCLKDFWLKPARNRVLYGGRSSSKSWDAAGFAIFLASNYKVRFLCTRQFQNKIAESVYTLLKIQAERFGIADQFKFTDNSIKHKTTGSEFVFYGIARNLDEIKSMEGVDIAWHEECHLMTENQWKVIDPTVRKEGSQHWLVFNPQFSNDFIYQRFVVNPPPDTVLRHINYNENLFLSNTMRKVIEAARLEDPDEFAHVYLGHPRSDDDRVVIKRSWIESAIDAHLKFGEPRGAKRLGFDVADSGADLSANIYAHGSVALWGDEWKGGEDELLKSCARTYQNALLRDADIVYDSIGVGASAGAKFDELNSENSSGRVRYTKFNAGESVFEPEAFYTSDKLTRIKNKDFFSNLKSQSWWLIADRFRNTHDYIKNGTEYPEDELISISSDMPKLEKLKTELSTPFRKFDNNGRVKVESKEDMAKRDIKSPNLADAFIMAFAPRKKAMNISGSALANVGGRR